MQSLFKRKSHKMNGMAHGSQWSCACFAFASAFIPIPVTQTNNGVHVVHQFETTPKKNFCMRETHFNFIFYFGIRWNRWVRDATPFCSTVYEERMEKAEMRYNRKLDRGNKYVNAFSSVRCIKFYNIFGAEPRKIDSNDAGVCVRVGVWERDSLHIEHSKMESY